MPSQPRVGMPFRQNNMTFRNKYLFIIFAIIAIAALIQQWVQYSNGKDDYVPLLAPTGKIEKIQVNFSNRDCDCPEWRLDNGEGTEKYFYLEPETIDLPNPDILANRFDSTSLLILEGQFLRGKGVPSYYDQKNTKQEPADVFRYTNFEIIKRN